MHMHADVRGGQKRAAHPLSLELKVLITANHTKVPGAKLGAGETVPDVAWWGEQFRCGPIEQ